MIRLPKQAIVGGVVVVAFASTFGVISLLGIGETSPFPRPAVAAPLQPVNKLSPVPSPAPDPSRLTLDGATGWINSDGPIHLDQLRGKIILLDFWTYCCVNCHHVLPDLAKLEAKYQNQLVVIGVHTAKFEAEKDTENIRSKVREYGIQHPVANDANQVIWNRFGARSWPTLTLIDASGQFDKAFAGEGHYAELESEIARLVAEAQAQGVLDTTPVDFPRRSRPPERGGVVVSGENLG